MATEPVLIVPDVHRPFHDHKAWRLMLKVAAVLKPRYVVVMGDLADCYAVSNHDKDAAQATRFAEEVDDVNEALDELDALGAKVKLYVEGNHEDRVRRYTMQHPELHNVLTIPKLFNLTRRGWRYTAYKDHTKIGKVHFTHDVGVASRNAIFSSLGLYQHSIVTGHTHRLMYVVENSALGNEPKVAASFGWLGDVEQVSYMTKAKARAGWALGFGIGHHDPKTGFMYLQPVPILPGYSCLVDGQVFK